MKAFPLLLVALAGCGQQKQAAVAQPAQAAAPVVDRAALATAEKLVRARLANSDAVKFGAATAYDNEGVEIVCGTFDHKDPDGTAATGQRYIAVGGEQSFVEPEMREGEMDKAVAQFCRNA